MLRCTVHAYVLICRTMQQDGTYMVRQSTCAWNSGRGWDIHGVRW